MLLRCFWLLPLPRPQSSWPSQHLSSDAQRRALRRYRLLLSPASLLRAKARAAPHEHERALLIRSFLEAGIEAGETTFYLTAETGKARTLAEKFQSIFYLFLCNLRADAIVPSLPNVFKLKGVENLTEIDIALIKAYRALNTADSYSKRVCIEIISNVLLQHHALTTRNG